MKKVRTLLTEFEFDCLVNIDMCMIASEVKLLKHV